MIPTSRDPSTAASAAASPLLAQRRTVWLLTTGAVVLLLGAVTWFDWHERRQQLDAASSLSARRASRLSDELTHALGVARVAIAQAEARLQELPVGASMRTVMGEAAQDRSAIFKALALPFELHALDASGRTLDLTEGRPGAAVHVHDHSAPGAAGANGDWAPDLPRGAPGSRVLPMQRRAAPNHHGVIAFSADFDHAALLARLESSRQPQGGSAALFRLEPDGSATVLVVAPHKESDLGLHLRGPLAQAVARASSAVMRTETELDPTSRTIAYQRLAADASGLVVAYAMATDAVLADWTERLPAVALVSLMLAAGMVWSGWRMDRSLRSLAQGQQAVRRSESRFRALADNLPDVVVRFDAQGRHLYANAAVERASGLPPAALIGKTTAELGMPSDNVAQYTAALQRVFEHGRTERMEFTYPGPEDMRHWESLVALEPRISGEAPTVLVISRDITERVQGLDNLRESEARHRQLFEAHPNPMWVYDLQTLAFLDVNAAAVVHYGYSREEFLRMTIKDIRPPENVPRLLETVARNVQGEQDLGLWHHVVRGGEVIDVQITSHTLPFKGRAAKLVQAQDVTHEHRAELALRASEARLAYLLRSTATVIYTASTRDDYNATYYSPNLSALLGWEPWQFIEDPAFWLNHVHADDREAVLAQMATLALKGEVVLEYRFLHADGSWRWMRDALRQARDGAGSPTELVGSWIDITAHREAEDQVRQLAADLEQRVRERTADLQQAMERAESASRAKSDFLSHMSHELRTPLNAVLGFAQIIEMSAPSPRQLEWAGQIHRAGNHLLQMIEDLLDLARIEVGKVAIRAEAIALAPLLAEAVALVQPLIEARGLRLNHDCPDIATPVKTDRLRLRQVLVNLLSNAAKYNREGGTITLRCERQGERMRLSVADTGIGIAAPQLARLFRPFERLGAELGKIEGTGIGLALSSQLARLMDATLGVQSQEGVGSVFWIELPCAKTDTQPGLEQVAPPRAQGRLDFDLLYVEDNVSNVELVSAFLAQHAHIRLRSAGDGIAGLALARARRPDCILLDIHLPGLDGYQILQQLRADAELARIPVVALSADAMPQEIQRALAAGFDHYLAKPVDLNELLKVLQRLLRTGAA